MDSTIGTIITFTVIGILLFAAGYRYGVQKRQLRSGRKIAEFAFYKKNEKLVFDHVVSINSGKRWCRLLFRFKAETAYQIDTRVRYLRKPVAMMIGTRYAVTISDAGRRVLYREEDKLTRFMSWATCKSRGVETMFGEQGTATQEGTVCLLDFLPRQSGSHRILCEVDRRIDGQAEGSSSYWELLEAELIVMEDVVPLSKIVKYPHNRIQL